MPLAEPLGVIGGNEAPIDEVLVSQAEIEETESELPQVDDELLVVTEEVVDEPSEDQDTNPEAAEEVFVERCRSIHPSRHRWRRHSVG